VPRAILLFFATIGALAFTAVVVVLAVSWAVFSPAGLPDRIVLELDLEGGLVETLPGDPFLMALDRNRLRTRDVVEALEAAAGDDRVVGLLVRGGGGLPGWGTAEELREAVTRFRAAGKPAVFFAGTFGELSPGQLSYHLATAFEAIHLQPSGDVGLAPLLMEAPFLRGALDRLEVEPRFDRRGEYKDAQEMFTESGFTPEAREAREVLLASLEAGLLEGMSAGRGFTADSARTLLLNGPFPAREARAAGLVDELLYLDQVRELLSDGSPEFLSVERYRTRGPGAWDRGPRVALVYGVGAIQRGRGGFDFLSGGSALGADVVSRAIRDAVEDDRVRAILFRVDSPGGSWVASDQVRREIRRARERGIPVVVSMGDLAASGGYVISMDADRIVAHPSTFTGSIGVLAGKLVTEEFFASMGIEWDQVRATEGGDFYSGVRDFNPNDWDRFQLFLDRVYEDFVAGVAEAREMTVAQVDAVARGRIWSGRDAVRLGLVDRVGGFGVALDEIRGLLGEEAGAPLQVAVYPAERTLLQLLLEEGRRGERAGSGVDAGWLAGLAAPARALLEGAARAGLLGTRGPVGTPPLGVPGR